MSTTSHQLVNDQIRVNSVFLIMPNGDKVGKTATRQAIFLAQQEGLDLVQVTQGEIGGLPIAKMIDLGKLKYKQAKQTKQHHHDDVKEIQFKINIDPHDLETKNRKVTDLLKRKYKVRYTLEVKGRQKALMGDALEYFKSLLPSFEEVATWESPNVSGGFVSIMLSPKGH